MRYYYPPSYPYQYGYYTGPRPANEVRNQFMRGFVATGILNMTTQAISAEHTGVTPEPMQALKRAVQGGAAMAAGTAAANRMDQGQYFQAASSIGLGLATVTLAERLLNSPSLEHEDD